jgi:ABC-type nitrate/sulfonate/bicarbonate transport system permease component
MAIAPKYWKLARQYSEAAVAIIGLVVAWQVLCDVFNVPRWLLPSPRRIAIETWEIRAILPTHFLATLWAVLGGFALAIAAGIPLAIMVVYSPFLRRVIYPVLLTLQSVPKVAIAPLLLLWVGYGLQSNIIVAATVAFFPIVINTAIGGRRASRAHPFARCRHAAGILARAVALGAALHFQQPESGHYACRDRRHRCRVHRR